MKLQSKTHDLSIDTFPTFTKKKKTFRKVYIYIYSIPFPSKTFGPPKFIL